MKDELKRKRILKSLQKECCLLGSLIDTLEQNLKNKE